MKNKTVLMSGNEAIAEGALYAGCRFYAGYPITPQNELIAYMAHHMRKRGGVFIQAESELSAINMVFGASASGVRAMTSSSSPGISLKQEGISYLAGAQLPAVIVNIMRGGPGLGNIAPAQSDYFQATRGGGHGDYRTIVLAPGTVQEAYGLMPVAFSLADRYRNPVMVLCDGMLGQMMEPVKVASDKWLVTSKGLATHHQPLATKSWVLTGCKGRKPNVVKSFFMYEGDLERHNEMLNRKYRRIQRNEQRGQMICAKDASVIIAAYGMMARIAQEAVHSLRKKGMPVGMLRPITLWPFPGDLFDVCLSSKRKPKILTVEMSNGQMHEDVRLTVQGRTPVDLLGKTGGGIPTVEMIKRKVIELLK